MTKAEIQREADDLYPRLHPSQTYTMLRAVATELLLRMPGGEIWWNGSRCIPRVRGIGAGVVVLSFRVLQ